MKELWKSADEVLDYAIGGEKSAVETYSAIAKQSTSPAVKSLFESFAAEEASHLKKLLETKKRRALSLSAEELQAMPPRPSSKSPVVGEMDLGKAYRLAIKSEQSAYELYTALSQMTTDPKIRQVFESLATDEHGHKMKLAADLQEQESSGGFFKKLVRFATNVGRKQKQ